MARDPKVNVTVTGKDEATPVLDKVENRAKGFANGMSTLVKGALAGLAAGAVGSFFKSAVEESNNAAKEMGFLSQALTNVGANAQKLAPELSGVLGDMALKYGKDGGDLTLAFASLTTTTGNYKTALSALPTVLDVAAARNIDMASASDLVSKALNGNAGALSRLGVSLKDNETPFDALRRSYSGFAEQDANTFNGALGRIGESWRNVLQAVGDAITGNDSLAKGSTFLVDKLAGLEEWIRDNEQAISDMVDAGVTLGKWTFQAAGFIGVTLVRAFQGAQIIIIDLVTAFQSLGPAGKFALGTITESFGEFLEKLNVGLSLFGLDFDEKMVDGITNAGTKMKLAAQRQINELKKVREAAIDSVFTGDPDKPSNTPSVPKTVPTGKPTSLGSSSKTKDKTPKDAILDEIKLNGSLLDIDNARTEAMARLVAIQTEQTALAHNDKLSKEARAKAIERANAAEKEITDFQKKQADEVAAKAKAEKDAFDKKLDHLHQETQLTDRRKDAEAQLIQIAKEQKAIADDTTKSVDDRLVALQRYQDAMAAGGLIEKQAASLQSGFAATGGDSFLKEYASHAFNLEESLGRLAGEALPALQDAFSESFTAMGQGAGVWKSLGDAAKKTIGQMAGAEGKHEFGLALAAFARAFNPNPLVSAGAVAEGTKHLAAGAFLSTLGGALSGGGGGGASGPGSAGSTSASNLNSTVKDAKIEQGETNVTIQNGNGWMNDPRTMDQVAQLFNNARGNRINFIIE